MSIECPRLSMASVRRRWAAALVSGGVLRAISGPFLNGRCAARVEEKAAEGRGEVMDRIRERRKAPSWNIVAGVTSTLPPTSSPTASSSLRFAATEEAIVNSLCMADEMRGQSGHVAPALPLDKLSEILGNYRKAFAK